MADKKTIKAAPKAKKAAKATEVKTVEVLEADVAKLRADHQEALRSHRAGDLVNPRVLTTGRKAIARALTALNQAQRSAAVTDAPAKEEN